MYIDGQLMRGRIAGSWYTWVFVVYQEILLKLPMITDDRADDTDTERKEMWKCYYF